MKSEKFDLSDVVRVFESRYSTEVNRYLKLGWVLLSTYSDHYSEHGYAPRYCLGWPKYLGEVKVPEKTQREIDMEKFANSEECPF